MKIARLVAGHERRLGDVRARLRSPVGARTEALVRLSAGALGEPCVRGSAAFEPLHVRPPGFLGHDGRGWRSRSCGTTPAGECRPWPRAQPRSTSASRVADGALRARRADRDGVAGPRGANLSCAAGNRRRPLSAARSFLTGRATSGGGTRLGHRSRVLGEPPWRNGPVLQALIGVLGSAMRHLAAPPDAGRSVRWGAMAGGGNTANADAR